MGPWTIIGFFHKIAKVAGRRRFPQYRFHPRRSTFPLGRLVWWRSSLETDFEGANGDEAVSVVDKDKHRMVDVETREFEYQIKRFLETI